jgi:hypothetical protein
VNLGTRGQHASSRPPKPVSIYGASVVSIYGASVGFLHKIGISMHGYGQEKKKNIEITRNTIVSFNIRKC